MTTPDHSHEPDWDYNGPPFVLLPEDHTAANMARWRETQRNRLWCLVPLSLACLCGGGLVVFALVKALLA